MNLTGQHIIGKKYINSLSEKFYSINPETGEKLEPGYFEATSSEVDLACELAERAKISFRTTSLEQRALFLEMIAREIENLGESLIVRCIEETGLPSSRLQGERKRTCDQLRLFASVLRNGKFLDIVIDSEEENREPVPRVDLRRKNIAIGPVAVFGASNFPLAFSVAGGDTASAFAAGCPVVVKAHPAHLGTSEMVGKAIQKAIKKCELPEGVFSLLFGSDNDLGSNLVKNPIIKAVGFTGSYTGGIALMSIANNRKVPIPVYAEMSGINPVFILPDALKKKSVDLANGFVQSFTMGAGQFCTNPGVLFVIKTPELDKFLEHIKHNLSQVNAQIMLTKDILKSYEKSLLTLKESKGVQLFAEGKKGLSSNHAQSNLFIVQAKDFLSNYNLKEEVFGASSLIVVCKDIEQLIELSYNLDGQLTATLQMTSNDIEVAQRLLPILEDMAGRILVNNWPTGVEVCHAMVHGGPFPSTSNSKETSVGSAAIYRFLRPVCYQNFSQELLPVELKNISLNKLPYLLDGKQILPI